MKLNDKLYNFLKYLCITGLPALTTLYGVIGATFNIPYTRETLIVLTAVNTCLGTMLGISSAQYYKNASENPQMDKVMAAVTAWLKGHAALDQLADNETDVPEE